MVTILHEKRSIRLDPNPSYDHEGCDLYLYAVGYLPPHYPVPALASVDMCICLNWIEQADGKLAYDGIWKDVLWTSQLYKN